MQRRVPTPPLSLRSLVAAVLTTAIAIVAVIPPSSAATPKQLQRVRGTIGYQTTVAGADFKPVFGRFELPDEDFAATRAASAAVLEMPDSSLISLGENTTVKVSAFDNSAAGPGSTITVNGGSLRFDIRRPDGGAANYRFTTTTSQIGVRGTIGLLSFVNGITTVGCVVCAADSVTVTVGTQTIALAAGQVITVSAAGVITTAAMTAATTGTFGAAGVSTSSEASAAAAGLPAGAAGSAITGAVAAAAVAGAAVAGVSAAQNAPAPAAAQPTPNSGAVTPAPLPSPTEPGSVNLNGHAIVRPPTPSPSPRAVAPPAPPAAHPSPPPSVPGGPMPGRFGR